MRRRTFLSALPAATALASGLAASIPPRHARAAPARFVTEYIRDPPPAVRGAFQYALDQWARVLTSDVQIPLQMSWDTFGFPVGVNVGRVVNFPGAPRRDVIYPATLANRIAGSRVAQGANDFRVGFNARVSVTGVPDVFSWYLGTDGRPSPVEFDLVTSAMAAIGYALGQGGTFRTAGTAGQFGTTAGTPYIFDTLLRDASGKPLLDYLNNSAELGDALRAGALVDGPRVRVAGGPFRFAEYTGTLDPETVSTCAGDALFSAFALLPGVAVRAPSAIDVAILGDMGWGAP
ncbi:MAG: hypothetical protein ACKVT1_13110 [Dehalococcoidia bacterium]